MNRQVSRGWLRSFSQLMVPLAIAILMFGGILFSASHLALAIHGRLAWRPEDSVLLGALGGFLAGWILTGPSCLKALPIWGFAVIALGVLLRVFFLEGHWLSEHGRPIENFASEMRVLAMPLILPILLVACGAVWVRWTERNIADAGERVEFAEKQRRRFYFIMIVLLIIGHGLLSMLESSGKIELLEGNWLGFPGWLWLLTALLVYPLVHFARETTATGLLIAMIAMAAVVASVLVHFIPYVNILPFLPVGIFVGVIMLLLTRQWSRHLEEAKSLAKGTIFHWVVLISVSATAWLFCENHHQRCWRSQGYSIASLGLARQLRQLESSAPERYVRYRQLGRSAGGNITFGNDYWVARVELQGEDREPIKMDLAKYDLPALPVERIKLRGLMPGDRIALKNVKCDDITIQGAIDIAALPPLLNRWPRCGLTELNIQGAKLRDYSDSFDTLAPGAIAEYLKADPSCRYFSIYECEPNAADYAQIRIRQQEIPSLNVLVRDLKVQIEELGDKPVPTCFGVNTIEFVGGTPVQRQRAIWRLLLDGNLRFFSYLPSEISEDDRPAAVLATNLISSDPFVPDFPLESDAEKLPRELMQRKWVYEVGDDEQAIQAIWLPNTNLFDEVCTIPGIRKLSLDEMWAPWTSRIGQSPRRPMPGGLLVGNQSEEAIRDAAYSTILTNSKIEALYFSTLNYFNISKEVPSLKFLQIGHQQLVEIDPEKLPNLESVVLLEPDWIQFSFPKFQNLKQVTIIMESAKTLLATDVEIREKLGLPREVELAIKTYDSPVEEPGLRMPEAWKKHREQLRNNLRRKYLGQ